MLDAHGSLLCSKLCQHEVDNPRGYTKTKGPRFQVPLERLPFKWISREIFWTNGTAQYLYIGIGSDRAVPFDRDICAGVYNAHIMYSDDFHPYNSRI